MAKRTKALYGRPVLPPTPHLTLAEQVYQVLREEMRSGHWQPGDRLPSVAALAKESGLTFSPIRRAFEQLCAEGHIRQNGRAGSFLAPANAKNRPKHGVIGIAVAKAEEDGRWGPLQYDPFYLHKTTAGAERQGYDLEVRYLGQNDDWSMVDRRGAFFSEAVSGVICFHPFPHDEDGQLGPGSLPFVHCGTNSRECLPMVGGDTHDGFCRLTKHVLSRGHRNIVCLGARSDSKGERESCFLGHELAMRRAGLKANRQAYQRSFDLPEDDLRALREFLEAYGAIPRATGGRAAEGGAGKRAADGGVTAVICMGFFMPKAVISLCDALGLSVPEDLSVAGHGHFRMRPADSTKFNTCVNYDHDQMADLCFELLAKQSRTRRYGISRLLVRMVIEEGDSLAAPRGPLGAHGARSAAKFHKG